MKNKKSWGSNPDIPKENGSSRTTSTSETPSPGRTAARTAAPDTTLRAAWTEASPISASPTALTPANALFNEAFNRYAIYRMGIIRDQMQVSEQRTNRNLFKIAVELGKLSHIVAAMNDVDDDTVHDLHAMIVDEVRRINGIINYESADKFQHDY